MGVINTTIRTYICDRCEFSSEDPYARGGNSSLKGIRSTKAYDGAHGGVEVSMWLCGGCTSDFLHFMKKGE